MEGRLEFGTAVRGVWVDLWARRRGAGGESECVRSTECLRASVAVEVDGAACWGWCAWDVAAMDMSGACMRGVTAAAEMWFARGNSFIGDWEEGDEL